MYFYRRIYYMNFTRVRLFYKSKTEVFVQTIRIITNRVHNIRDSCDRLHNFTTLFPTFICVDRFFVNSNFERVFYWFGKLPCR